MFSEAEDGEEAMTAERHEIVRLVAICLSLLCVILSVVLPGLTRPLRYVFAAGAGAFVVSQLVETRERRRKK